MEEGEEEEEGAEEGDEAGVRDMGELGRRGGSTRKG